MQAELKKKHLAADHNTCRLRAITALGPCTITNLRYKYLAVRPIFVYDSLNHLLDDVLFSSFYTHVSSSFSRF